MRKSRLKDFRHAGTETGGARVFGWSRAEAGQKTTAGGEGHQTSGGEGGAGTISKLRNNKQRSLGPEWSMSKVGNPPPHQLDKPHGLVASINNNNKPFN